MLAAVNWLVLAFVVEDVAAVASGSDLSELDFHLSEPGLPLFDGDGIRTLRRRQQQQRPQPLDVDRVGLPVELDGGGAAAASAAHYSASVEIFLRRRDECCYSHR